MRLRLIAPVLVVLAVTVGGFVETRMDVKRDAQRADANRADIAAAEVRNGIEQGATLVESLRRFMLGQGSATNAQFADIGARWLTPVGLPAAAWARQVPNDRELRATLVTGASPLTAPGIDLGHVPVVAGAIAQARTLFRVTATPLARIPDGKMGLFLIESAPRLNHGTPEPGYVVLFIPAPWLFAAVTTATQETNTSLQVRVGKTSYGGFGDAAAVGSTFTAAGRRFEVLVSQKPLRRAAAMLPWLVLGGGLVVAVFAGTLAAIAQRRARAQGEVERIFTLSPDLITVAGFDGLWKRVNPAFETLLGYTAREAVARPYLEFVHPADRKPSEEASRRIVEGEPIVAFTNRMVCKDGTYRWIEWTARPVPNERLLYGVGRDVTERRRSESEQAALRRVATLVAESVQPQDLFEAVAEEVARVFDVPVVSVARYEGDDTATSCASFSVDGPVADVRRSWSLDGTSVLGLVHRTGKVARLEDYAELEGELADAARQSRLRSTVGTPIVVAGRIWGVMAVSSREDPLPDGTEERLADFTELLATAIASAESHEALERLAGEQAALRRVATLVARDVPAAEVFSAVSTEVSGVFGAGAAILRYEDEGPAAVFIGVGAGVDLPVGTRWELQDGMAPAEVYRTGRSSRIDAKDWSAGGGSVATTARGLGGLSTVVTPIVVEGRLWGAMSLWSNNEEPLPPDAEERLESFTQLLATAIANAESREARTRLADEQAALRRVATLVAQGVPPEELFAAVTDEVGQLFPVGSAAMGRLDPDGLVTTVAAWSPGAAAFPVGRRWIPGGKNALSLVVETGRPARLDDFADASGPIGVAAREAGYRSAVGTPVIVDGRLWGVMTAASSAEEPLPSDIETRLSSFTELLATAIANAENRAGLARLVEEQAALGRVATLVAEGVPPAKVFSALCEEVNRLVDAQATTIGRREPDGKVAIVAITGLVADETALGARVEPEALPVTAAVLQTGRSVRKDDYGDVLRRSRVVRDFGIRSGVRDLGIRSGVGVPIVVEGALWGAIGIGTVRDRFPDDTEQRLEKFTELAATAIANAESREARARLAEEQAALRRVATLVAQGVKPAEMFAAVTQEISHVVDVPAVSVVRYEADGTATELANFFTGGRLFSLGVLNIEGTNILRLVRETGTSARIDDYSQADGEMAETVRRAGIRSTVGVPIVVAGRLWGTMVGSTTAVEALPDDTASRLADFTELLATAIENAESRDALERLAEEQAALRRVATLVAQGMQPAEIFSAVSDEAARMFEADAAGVVRFEHDDHAIVFVGVATKISDSLPVGTRWDLEDGMATAQVYRTGRSTRVSPSGWSADLGPVAATAADLGLVCIVASPIVVEGRLWGAVTLSDKKQLPADVEERLENFGDLVATAIANAESKSELAASRRRIVAASDQTRRQIERDLHDGAQQRLVSLELGLRAAEADVPDDRAELRAELSRVAGGLADAVEELRELSRGIHPAILSEGGLGPALRTLARRSRVPVELTGDIDRRLPERVEVAAYYVASEALTNVAKHAHASVVRVDVGEQNGTIRLAIRDDGIGGVDPGRGSGLVGLQDRVEALDGKITIDSVPGNGTLLVATLPVDVETADAVE